jgi:glutathione-regulated potassium-efflux system ancillary protein KefG
LRVPARVLVLFAHPALQKSRVNRHLAAAARHVPGVTFHDLYEAYPDFHLKVAREQAQLVAHDVIVFQHPFYWYGCPTLSKEWLDLVLEYGFAFGPAGTQLHGKNFSRRSRLSAPPKPYSRDGHNHFTMRELLAPFE